MRFAQVQVKLGLATLIKTFKFKHHEDTSYPMLMDNMNVVVTSLKPMKIIAEKV